jgi:hypothetical protein
MCYSDGGSSARRIAVSVIEHSDCDGHHPRVDLFRPPKWPALKTPRGASRCKKDGLSAADENRPALQSLFQNQKLSHKCFGKGTTSEVAETRLYGCFWVAQRCSVRENQPEVTQRCATSQNPAPEGRTIIVRRFSAGKSGENGLSPGRTAKFSAHPAYPLMQYQCRYCHHNPRRRCQQSKMPEYAPSREQSDRGHHQRDFQKHFAEIVTVGLARG